MNTDAISCFVQCGWLSIPVNCWILPSLLIQKKAFKCIFFNFVCSCLYQYVLQFCICLNHTCYTISVVCHVLSNFIVNIFKIKMCQVLYLEEYTSICIALIWNDKNEIIVVIVRTMIFNMVYISMQAQGDLGF